MCEIIVTLIDTFETPLDVAICLIILIDLFILAFLFSKYKLFFFLFIIIALFALSRFTMASNRMRYDKSYLKYGYTVLRSKEEE